PPTSLHSCAALAGEPVPRLLTKERRLPAVASAAKAARGLAATLSPTRAKDERESAGDRQAVLPQQRQSVQRSAAECSDLPSLIGSLQPRFSWPFDTLHELVSNWRASAAGTASITKGTRK